MKASDLKKLRQRDDHCWDCGEVDDLVPHHRANRGHGGYKSADNFQNVIMVCAYYNGLMESDAKVAEEARQLGHKISKFIDPSVPVFDKAMQAWFYLDKEGGKVKTEPPEQFF